MLTFYNSYHFQMAFLSAKISSVVTILKAAKISGEELSYYQEFTFFRSDRAYNFIP